MPTFDTTTPVLPPPRYSYAVEHDMATLGPLFEDGTEQRYLISSATQVTLFYDYTTCDSATMSSVRSIFLDANGPATIFTAMNFQTGTVATVRFAELELRVQAREGNAFRVGPIGLRVIS